MRPVPVRTEPAPPRSRWVLACVLLLAPPLALSLACDEDKLATPPATSASASAGELPPELAAKPLAKVGDRVITLGDFAATINRMDPFERLRYQSEERRKQLLDEMIEVELMAQEARRRGLDKQPETRTRIRQILRDELLGNVRAELPSSAEIPEAEVRAYYDAHRAEYKDPERRRVSHIELASEAQAKTILAKAKDATPAEWGKLVKQHSQDKASTTAATPLELEGDLGIVSAPGAEKGDNPRVAEPLRKAVFEIAKIGDVYDGVVESGGKFHLVRMTGRTEARERSYAEVERTIRVALLQDKLEKLQERLAKDLEKRFEVKIDEAALAKVKVPALEEKGGGGTTPPKK